MLFGGTSTIYVYQGVKSVYYHKYKTHALNMSMAYNVMFMGLAPRFLTTALHYLGGYQKDICLSASTIITFIGLNSLVLHSYFLNHFQPLLAWIFVLALTINTMVINRWFGLGHGRLALASLLMVIGTIIGDETLTQLRIVNRPATTTTTSTIRSTTSTTISSSSASISSNNGDSAPSAPQLRLKPKPSPITTDAAPKAFAF